jgi:hypothetical protein
MSGDRPTEFVVQPIGGASRARLAVVAGVLTATDDRGRAHRYPIDGGEAAPAVVVGTAGVTGSGSFAVLDAAGRAMVVTPASMWPAAEMSRLAEAAGLPFEMRGLDGKRQVLGLRKDGIRLGSRSGPSLSAATIVLPILVLISIVAARLGALPFAVVAVLFVGFVAATRGPLRRAR